MFKMMLVLLFLLVALTSSYAEEEDQKCGEPLKVLLALQSQNFENLFVGFVSLENKIYIATFIKDNHFVQLIIGPEKACIIAQGDGYALWDKTKTIPF